MFKSRQNRQDAEPPKKLEVVLPKKQENELPLKPTWYPPTHKSEQDIRKIYVEVEESLEHSYMQKPSEKAF